MCVDQFWGTLNSAVASTLQQFCETRTLLGLPPCPIAPYPMTHLLAPYPTGQARKWAGQRGVSGSNYIASLNIQSYKNDSYEQPIDKAT